MEPSCDAAAAPSTSTMNSRRFDHLIRAVRAREGIVSAWGQQRPRSCETARGLGRNLPRRTASQQGGITCSMRGSRSPWRWHDDRLRRSSPTHKAGCKHTAMAMYNTCCAQQHGPIGQSFRSAFERGQVHLDHGKPPWPEAMVAVGTRISPRPPHRSRRALLTHRAPPSGQTSCDERFSHVRRPTRSHYSDRRGISAQCPNRGRLTAVPLG